MILRRLINNSDGTLLGEHKVRQLLDKAYEDAGGEYTQNKGLDQIHRAARDAITLDVESKAVTTEVKQAYQGMTRLYRGYDVLLEKARAEGGSKFQRFVKENPVVSKAAEMVARTAGLGAGIHLVP